MPTKSTSGDAIIDPSWTVNEIVAHHPATAAVFNRFGLDICCGGAVTPELAAVREGLDPRALREALQQAVDAP